MRRIALWTVVALATALPACAPTVSIHHLLPAPAIPAHPPYIEGVLRIGEVELTAAEAKPQWKDLLQKAWPNEPPDTRTRLLLARPANWPAGSIGTVPDEVLATAAVDVAVEEKTGTRDILRGRPDGEMVAVEVPYLTRTVDMTVVFTLRGRDGVLATVESRQGYDSLADPTVRGELGLGRPDDPETVPSVGSVLEELFLLAVDDLYGQITPIQIDAEVKMRDVGGEHGQAGLKAARGWSYAEAADHFRALLDADPSNTAARFDLAVACEAAGMRTSPDGFSDTPSAEAAGRMYAEAIKAYREVLQADDKDAEAAEGVRRVRRVLASVAPLPESADTPAPTESEP